MFDKFTLVSFISLGLICFIGGYDLATIKAKYQLKEIEVKTQEALNAALKEQLTKEREYYNAVTNAQNSFDLSASAINNHFESLHDSKLFDSSQWLSEWPTSSGDKTLSDTSTDTAKPVTETQCRCTGRDRLKLSRVQKLYEKELAKARQCDLNAVQLNSLIDIVEKLQRQ